ncbi:MAG: hydrogenase maturation protease, partial [Bacteroidota bacterium]
MRIKIIGIGNINRSDDSLGLVILQQLSEMKFKNVIFENNYGDGFALIESMKNFDKVILIDSISSDSNVGKFHKIDVNKNQFDFKFSLPSTHSFGILEAIKLAKQLKKLPNRCFVFGIEGKDFSFSKDLSTKTNSKLVNAIINEIKKNSSSRLTKC